MVCSEVSPWPISFVEPVIDAMTGADVAAGLPLAVAACCVVGWVSVAGSSAAAAASSSSGTSGDIAMIVGAGLPRPSFENSVSSNWAVCASRSRAVRPPMTTEIRRVPPRVAELARLKPDIRV